MKNIRNHSIDYNNINEKNTPPLETPISHGGGLRHLTGTVITRILVGNERRPVETAGKSERDSALKLSDAISGHQLMRTIPSDIRVLMAKGRLREPGISKLVEKYGEYRCVLGGEVCEMLSKAWYPPVQKRYNWVSNPSGHIIRDMMGPKSRMGMSEPWDTGVDIGALVNDYPRGRFKFYLSIDPSQAPRANEFINMIHKLATKERISMATKGMDHAYDSPDLYTWSPVEMAEILRGSYAQFPDIWRDVEHPLQGVIKGINPLHIGFVHEPTSGYGAGNKSHSSRMNMLGACLDREVSKGNLIDTDVWTKACREAKVMPEAPWLIDFDVV